MTYAQIGILSLAVAAISFTTSKAVIFRSLRLWIDDRNEWLGELVACPYCTAHWVAFAAVAIYQPRPVNSGALILDLFVSAMAIVAVASIVVGIIFIALKQLGGEQ